MQLSQAGKAFSTLKRAGSVSRRLLSLVKEEPLLSYALLGLLFHGVLARGKLDFFARYQVPSARY